MLEQRNTMQRTIAKVCQITLSAYIMNFWLSGQEYKDLYIKDLESVKPNVGCTMHQCMS